MPAVALRDVARGAPATARPGPARRDARPWRARAAGLVLAGLAAASLGGGTAARPFATRPALSNTPLFVADYDNGMSVFDSTPWNNLPDGPTLVTSPTYDGYYAARFAIPAGGRRSESVPHLRAFREGDDLWFSWATRLGADFPLDTGRWQVLDQWKNAGIGSPPLAIGVTDDRFSISGGYGWPGDTTAVRPKLDSRPLGPARAGVWDRWTVHIVFSSDPRRADVSVRRNGVVVVEGWHPRGGTLYPGLTSYLKIGYYRDPLIDTPGTVYQDRLAVGLTLRSVT